MRKQNQPDRREASILAAAMAVAGAPFLFDRLASLVHSGIPSLTLALRAGLILGIVTLAIILLTDSCAGVSNSCRRHSAEGDRDEL